MQRTLYVDGVEVDASDLNNTEDTKVAEILLSRQTVARYGVIAGLTCINSANRITVNTGSVLFKNGEVASLDSPIVGVSGASFDAGVSTFVGLRLTEVTSNQKPHEVDPTLFDTRAEPELQAELFVAADNTDGSRAVALKAAVDAEVNDGNFILLAEFVGNSAGTGLNQNAAQNAPQARTQGGSDPFRHQNVRVSQINNLVKMYSADELDNFPFESAEDHMHRSLIGGNDPSPTNPHGLTLHDIGGDSELDHAITQHQKEFHANGIIGLEPAETTDFTPDAGSLFWTTEPGGVVQIRDLLPGEILVIQGKRTLKDQITNITNGVFLVGFNTAPSGLYYIVAVQGSQDQYPTFTRFKKDGPDDLHPSLAGGFDSLCVNDEGVAAWLDDAVDTDGERKFFVLGLVQWNSGGGSFVNLNANAKIVIPGPNGDITYDNSLPAGHPFTIPTGQTRLDLRRFGVLNNEDTQRRTLRLDRLTKVVITEDDFLFHAGLRVVAGTPVVVAGKGLHASPGGDQSVLKHLTDFDAFDLFGHRQRGGISQHALATASQTNDPNAAGFQSGFDKFRQDHLTMSLLKWSDIQDAQGDRSMGDAGATSVDSDRGVVYLFAKNGYITNMGVHVVLKGAINCRTFLNINGTDHEIGTALVGSGAFAPFQTFIFDDGTPTTRFAVTGGVPNTITCFHVISNRSDPTRLAKNLTVAVEFHFDGTN